MTGEVPYVPFQENAASNPTGEGGGAAGDATCEPFQGYVVTWDANERGPLSSEEFATVKKMLGGLGLRMIDVGELSPAVRSSTAEKERAPIIRSRNDFLAFAERSGATTRLATMAWNMVEATHDTGHDVKTYSSTPLRFYGMENGARGVDLNTARARLAVSGYAWDAWVSYGDAKISFLRTFIEAHNVHEPGS